MRTAFIALALIAAAANAQYKTPPSAPPTQPGAVQVAPNNNLQITTSTTNPDDELSKARRINRDEAIRLVKEKKAVWIDVRPNDQYEQSHVPGAINIPLSELTDHLTTLPPRKFLITYCA